ncbi:MAG: OmpA family protein [Eubacterium sp.]|nr:OmpA family protein [Eubacterium sp.]
MSRWCEGSKGKVDEVIKNKSCRRRSAMKNTIKMFLLVVAMLLMFTGCDEFSLTHSSNDSKAGAASELSEGELAVSFVCGMHESYPFYGALMSPEVQDAAYNVAYYYGDVSAYIVDADPFIAINEDIKKPDVWIDNAKRKMIAEENELAILNGLTSEDVIAKCDEVNTLQAISLSANSLKSSSAIQKQMYILDSGLSTAGVLDFAHQNIIDSDPEYIVEMLKEQHAIPDLSGIVIKWIGFGQTCGEQQTLTADYLYKLKSIWAAILEAGGAVVDDNTFNMGALEDIEIEYTLPYVTPVPVVVSPVSAQINDNEMADEAMTNNENSGLIDDKTIMAFREDTSVNFQPNSSEFIDETLAANDLSPVVEYLKVSPDNKIYIAGMTATYGDSESCKTLSLERGNAVKNSIMKADTSISEDQIRVLGLGYEDNPLRVQDVINGQLVEEEAKKNRAVYVLGENADVLEYLLNIALIR